MEKERQFIMWVALIVEFLKVLVKGLSHFLGSINQGFISFAEKLGIIGSNLAVALTVAGALIVNTLIVAILGIYLFLALSIWQMWYGNIGWGMGFAVISVVSMVVLRYLILPWFDTKIPIIMDNKERLTAQKFGAKLQLTQIFLAVIFLEPLLVLQMFAGIFPLENRGSVTMVVLFLGSIAAMFFVLAKLDLALWLPEKERMKEASNLYRMLVPRLIRSWVLYTVARGLFLLLVSLVTSPAVQDHLKPAVGRVVDASVHRSAEEMDSLSEKIEKNDEENSQGSGVSESQETPVETSTPNKELTERQRKIRKVLCEGGRTKYCD